MNSLSSRNPAAAIAEALTSSRNSQPGRKNPSTLERRASKRHWAFLHREQVGETNRLYRALYPDKTRRQARERMRRHRAALRRRLNVTTHDRDIYHNIIGQHIHLDLTKLTVADCLRRAAECMAKQDG